MKPILKLQNIGYFYCRRVGHFHKEKVWTLNDISFTVYHSQTVGIIGKNGVGKTTLLKIIAGILEPDKGTIFCDGIKSSLLSLQAGFSPFLTGRENAFLNGMLLGMKKNEIINKIDSIEEFADIGEFFDQPIKSYSIGMRARLGFSIAIQLNSDLLLIDEIMGVGDDEFRKKSTKKMKEQINSTKTVLIVSHIPSIITELCERAILIADGRIICDDTPDKVLNIYSNYY
jgi:lipopolysaccharide transport system ATP-binding protein